MKYNSNRETVLRFIVAYKQAHDGNSPSYDDIVEGTSLAKSTVNHHLDKLRKEGRISFDDGAQRSIVVKGGRWVMEAENE